mgnify:CR=1 FL=1
MEGTIRIAGTVGESIVDGPGFRYTLFVQGCPHGCPGCHNPQTHDFDGGQDIALDTLLKDMCKNPFVKGVTFSGGEPFCKAEPLYRLAVELKSRGKHLMAYSGYTFEELMQLSDPYVKKLLGELDLLVDGRQHTGQTSSVRHSQRPVRPCRVPFQPREGKKIRTYPLARMRSDFVLRWCLWDSNPYVHGTADFPATLCRHSRAGRCGLDYLFTVAVWP